MFLKSIQNGHQKLIFAIFTRVFNRFCWFLVSNTGSLFSTFFCNFENNRSIIASVRVLSLKKSKWLPWRHRFRNFEIRESQTLQISVRSFLENFIKIAPSVWAVKITQIDWQTDIQTDRHTYRHTDTLGQSQHIYCLPNASSSLQFYLRQKL